MDILLTSFVKKHINNLNASQLEALGQFLEYDDEIISNFYNFDIISQDINKNIIFNIFKKFKI